MFVDFIHRAGWFWAKNMAEQQYRANKHPSLDSFPIIHIIRIVINTTKLPQPGKIPSLPVLNWLESNRYTFVQCQ